MPDTGYPNYLSLDAHGRVTADFAGHVHATGLDLDAGTSSAAPDDRKVRWLDTLGNIIAQAFGYTSAPQRAALDLNAKSPVGSGAADLLLDSESDVVSRIRASVTDDTHGNRTFDVARSDGQSSYVQVGGGALKRARLWGPFFKSVSGIAAGATQDFVSPSLGVDLTTVTDWHVIGAFDMVSGGAGAWLDWCTWAIVALTSPDSFTVRVANQGGGATVGRFRFVVLTIG